MQNTPHLCAVPWSGESKYRVSYRIFWWGEGGGGGEKFVEHYHSVMHEFAAQVLA